MLEQKQRVAIVTGGVGGIGSAVAERFGADGMRVAVNHFGDSKQAEAVVQRIALAGGLGVAFEADVADERAISELFDEVENLFGGVDIVVHAAGRKDLAPLADFDLATLDELFRINIRGTFVVSQQAARRIRTGGSILNFSSSVLGKIMPSYTGYAATKGAIEAMTFILASELGSRDINVNAIAPGPIATSMFFEGKDENTIARSAESAPLRRLGTPFDVAEAVAFLTSGAGHWINGQVIRANGGTN